jgi:opacity protein-like surface antigen
MQPSLLRLSLALASAAVVSATVLSGVAQAQTLSAPSPPETVRGYVEAVAQSSFGDATSQSYGGEAGVTVWKNLQVFVEFGQIRNLAPAALGASAQQIAAFLSQTQTGVSVSVKQPASFGVAGLKYLIPTPGARIRPYVLGGVGLAKVTRKVSFFANGTDVTGQLLQLGVALGTDLSGEFTKSMLTIGGGVEWPAWRMLVVDFQVRFSRIAPEDDTASAINVGRAGLGVGIRF